MFVGIAVAQKSRTLRALEELKEKDEEALRSHRSIREQKETSKYDDDHPFRAGESQNENNETADSLDSITLPQLLRLHNGIVLRTPSKQPEFEIRKATGDCLESPALGVGDILVLDEMEDLNVNSGGLVLVGMGYNVLKSISGS